MQRASSKKTLMRASASEFDSNFSAIRRSFERGGADLKRSLLDMLLQFKGELASLKIDSFYSGEMV
jgi:hypothetical protein